MGDVIVIDEWLEKKASKASFEHFEAIKNMLYVRLEQEGGECFCYGG